MADGHGTLLFFAAALAVAITPGPGIFYVAARTLGAVKNQLPVLAAWAWTGGRAKASMT